MDKIVKNANLYHIVTKSFFDTFPIRCTVVRMSYFTFKNQKKLKNRKTEMPKAFTSIRFLFMFAQICIVSVFYNDERLIYLELQSNHSNTDTEGTEQSVRIREVSVL